MTEGRVVSYHSVEISFHSCFSTACVFAIVDDAQIIIRSFIHGVMSGITIRDMYMYILCNRIIIFECVVNDASN